MSVLVNENTYLIIQGITAMAAGCMPSGYSTTEATWWAA